jgi:hypothetical protein
MSEDKAEGAHSANELKEMLEVATQKIPALLNSLTDVLYGKVSAAKYGEAVANFYRTLKESGMTDEQAFRLTEQYMSSLNLAKIIGQAVGGRQGKGEKHWRVEVGKPDEHDEE